MLKIKQKMISIFIALAVLLVTVTMGLASVFATPTPVMAAEDTKIVFELGANGSATHKDGSTAKTTYSETIDGYTLSITGGTKMYPSSYDAKGNSCIKLGTSSVVGGFSFTVPDDVTSVSIAIAKYKANTTKITVNGTSYTLTKNSDNGEYDEIIVDTSTTKTVSLTTVSGGYRAMVNTITYVIENTAGGDEPACEHANTEIIYDSESKEHYKQCTNCETEIDDTREACSEFTYGGYTTTDGVHTRTRTCTVCDGEQTETGNCEVNAEYVREGNTHTQTGTCSICGNTTTVTKNCTLSYENVSNDDKTHNMTSTCSVCKQSATTENVNCTFDEGVLDGTTLTYTCKYCGYSYEETATMYTVKYVVPEGVTAPAAVEVAEGLPTELPTADDYQKYTFVGWVTEKLENDTETAPEFLKAKEKYTVTASVEFYALYMYTEENTEAEETWTLVTDSSSLAVGEEIVIVASGSNYALSTNQKSNNREAVAVTKGNNNNTVTVGDTVQIITLEAGTKSGTFAFNVGTGYLYAASSSDNTLKTKATLDDNGSWSITIDTEGVATIKAQGTYTRNWLRKNSSSALFACYASGQDDVSIYMKDGGAITYYTTPSTNEGEHSHSYDEGVVTAPTCTEEGYTTYTCECGDTYKDNFVEATGHNYEEEITQEATCTEAGEKTFICSVCSDSYTEVIPANGHVFVDGECSCGAKQDKKATLTFDDTSKRTEFSTLQQVWKENGITVTNEKSTSTTNVANYSNPVRFYKNSTVTIEYPGMVVIEIVANSGSYATALKDSITDEAVEVQVNGSTVTLIFAEAKDSYMLTCSEQIRVNAITTYTTTAHIDTASITVGESLSMNYYVILPDAYSSATMCFTLDKKTVEVINSEKQTDGRYKFTFVNIPPQCIAENITAAVVYNESEIAKLENYSIATYVNNQLEKIKDSTEDKDAKLRNLLNSILAYGEAAKNYCAGTESQGASEIPESANVFNIVNADLTNKEVKSYVVWFTGANLLFDYDNKICVTLSSTENVKLRVKINDGEYTDYTPTSTAFLTDGILPTAFDSVYTFELYYDGVLMQTLTYSVNSYAYKMQQNTKIGALCVTLYNYGVAAKAYQA